MERALRDLVVQGKLLTKLPFWRVKYLQTKGCMASEPAVS